MTEDPNQTKNSTRTINQTAYFLVYGLIILAGLFDTITPLARILVLLIGIWGLLSEIFYDRFMSSGPYDPAILLPLKFWPFSVLAAVAIATTGGISSGYVILLTFPIIIFSLDDGKSRSLFWVFGGYGLVLLFSLFANPARQNLIEHWPLIFIHASILYLLDYWIFALVQAFSREKEEKEKITHLGKEKSEFIGLASHHLRTPITSLKGYVDYFLHADTRQNFTADQVQILERMEGGIKKLETVVENLLVAASMESGKVQINLRLANLTKAISSVVMQYRTVVEERGLKLIGELKDEVALQEMLFDENKIRKVIANLLSNALKFTESGFIKVVLTVEDNLALVGVIDSGIGISKMDMTYLFQKFSRVSSVRGAFEQEGVGLGLYTSRLIVEAHGGKIWAQSEPGKGSAFYFCLPIAK